MQPDHFRRSRHRKPRTKPDLDIRATSRSVAILQLFDHYRNLPLNWMHALVDPDGSYAGFRNLCGRMVDAGLLERRTFNGHGNNNETQTYSRTDPGKTFLRRKGYQPYSDYNTSQDDEQVLIDLVDAQIQLGAKKYGVEVHHWPDIVEQQPMMPSDPFGFPELIPDGIPFYLKIAGGSALFLKEVIRENKTPKVLKHKIDQYRKLEEAIKRRYGFNRFFVLFITTRMKDRDNLLKWIGQSKWMLVSYMQDPIKALLTTIPVTTALFDDPWQRAGYIPFSLTTLSPVDDAAR